MLFLALPSRSPHFNLALEESLLATLPPAHPGWFLLWRDDPVVVIGRCQDAGAEVDASVARRLRVPVVRRETGGGAVYHDSGNLNFSFIENARRPPAYYSNLIVAALADLGFDARATGRNDIEIAGRKVCGLAETRRSGAVLRHGCLLYDVDFRRVAGLLTPERAKLEKRGLASAAARVVNLKELKPDLAPDALRLALLAAVGARTGIPPAEAFALARRLEFNKYRSSVWNMGRNSRGEREKTALFPWGRARWSWRLEGGVVAESRISGDFFSERPIEELENLLNGSPPGAVEPPRLTEYFVGCDPAVMRAFFAGAK